MCTVWPRQRSRSPRRQAQGQTKCGFCGGWGICEYGRELSFCSGECYRASTKGRDVLVWDQEELQGWLHEEGLDRWQKRLNYQCHDGHDLLTLLNEGQLCKAGVPRPKARSVMKDVETLRQGAWFQPEPPLQERPLDVVAELGKPLRHQWKELLNDHEHRSYAAYCPRAVDAATAWRWFETLKILPWLDLRDERHQADGRTIPRRTVFMVNSGCKCVYKYSGVKVPPLVEPQGVAEIREMCVALAGLKTQPNSCNVNIYEDGMGSVGWHTDNEPIFEAEYQDACILSLSLGGARKFQLKRQKRSSALGWTGPSPEESRPMTVTLSHGDLCTMEGMFQRHYLHAVPKEPRVHEPRINLTWRWITKHNKEDGCPLHGPGN